MCNQSEQGLVHRSTTNHERVESRLDKTMVGLRPTLSTTNCANQSPASATCPGSSFSIFTPGDAVAFHFFDRIAVAIVIESICDRVDSNSWTVPRSRQFVDTEHPGRRSQFPDCRPTAHNFREQRVAACKGRALCGQVSLLNG